jgi:hypothetical protein
MRWMGHVARMGKGEAFIGFWWENLRKTYHIHTRRKLEDNIKMNLQKVGCGGINWIELVQDIDRWRALVNVIMNLRVP